MSVWSQLEVDKAHVAYAVVSVCCLVFAVCSLFLKEKLFLSEATVSVLAGVIVGPKALNWFNPLTWSSNSNYLIQEISRVILIIQLFSVSVELPPKYLKKHFKSLSLVLFVGMTFGWLVTAAMIYILFTKLNFADALLISGCVTATDPVLAAAIVGKGKFGQRIPAHLKNLLSAESGANDGLAFPFVLLATQLVVRYGQAGEIIKEWILVSILYECVFGPLLGVIIGYVGRKAIRFCETKDLIDRESFFVFYIFLSLMCTGFGSMLGVDDLLVSFFAGASFAWDGWFQKKTEDSNLSNIIDLLLNLCYFLFLGSVIPWSDFNNAELGLNAWRLVLLGIAVIFLRRIPVFLCLKPFVPDLKSWREALFCGHFGPIGVGGIFCSMIALGSLEAEYTDEETPVANYEGPHEYLAQVLWPIVTFMVVTSIVIHGSSVTAMVFTNHVKHMTFHIKKQTTPDEASMAKESDEQEGPSSESVNKLTNRGYNRTAKRKSGSLPTEEQPAIPIQYHDNGTIRKPEYIYMAGQSTIVEDHDGEVLDEFEYPVQLQRKSSISQRAMRLVRPAKEHDFNINIDEKNNKFPRPLDKQILNVHQSGNEIFIENEDGDIIRRYVIQPNAKDEENQTSKESKLIPAPSRVNNQHTSMFDEEDIRKQIDSFIPE